uniref:Uncharacterized protein n=1 Tax=Agrobacterium albertimagni TaxID=147266 RepID=A0A7C1NTL0_9HYPH
MSVRCSLWTVDNEQVTVPIHLAYCSLAAALRRYARARSPYLAIVVVETPDAINSFVAAGRLYLEQILGRKESGNPFVRAIRRTKTDRLTEAEIYRDADAGRSILVCASLDDIEEELRLFADIVEVIREPTSAQITATFRKYGHVLSKDDEQMIAGETWKRLVYAFQRSHQSRLMLMMGQRSPT